MSARRPASAKRRIDLALGIALGVLLGIVVVVVFVFGFSEQTIDPPQLDRDPPVERPTEQ